MPSTLAQPEDDLQTVQCMEVWGGNSGAETSVRMRGLDAWVLSRPWKNEQAGGDVHYLSSCATGRIARVLIADVAGHGQMVAASAQRLRDLMRKYVNYLDQRKVARELNRQFVQESDGGTFATAVLATFWTPTDEVDLSIAGHPPPFVYRADAGRWEMISDDETRSSVGLPLGIEDGSAYSRRRLRLGPSDLLFVYTDGLLEAGVEKGQMLGPSGVLELLNRLGGDAPQSLLANLTDAVQERFGELPNDDVTLLLLRPNAAKPRASFVGGVHAGLRIVREVGRSVFGKAGPSPLPEVTVRNFAGAFVAKPNKTRSGGKAGRP